MSPSHWIPEHKTEECIGKKETEEAEKHIKELQQEEKNLLEKKHKKQLQLARLTIRNKLKQKTLFEK